MQSQQKVESPIVCGQVQKTARLSGKTGLKQISGTDRVDHGSHSGLKQSKARVKMLVLILKQTADVANW